MQFYMRYLEYKMVQETVNTILIVGFSFYLTTFTLFVVKKSSLKALNLYSLQTNSEL